MRLLVSLTVGALALSGCGWLYGDNGLVRDTRRDYITAKQEKPLQMPAEVTGFKPENYFEVPPLGNKPTSAIIGEELDVAPPALVLATAEGVHALQDKATPTAILIGDGQHLWQELQTFLESNEIKIRQKDDGQRQLETDWLESEKIGWWDHWIEWDEDLGYRWRYRFEMQPGERPNEHILTATALEMQRESRWDGWLAVPLNRRHSIDMMNRYLGYHDERVTFEARQRILAARAGITVELWQDEAGSTGLLAKSSLANTWDATPSVFAALGFELEDKDTSKKTYFFRLNEPDGGCFWTCWFGLGSDDQETIELELQPGEYVVQLSDEGDDAAGIIISEADGDIVKKDVITRLFPTLATAYQARRANNLFEKRTQ